MRFKVKTILNVLALGTGMTGSVLVAANIDVNIFGYILFLISSITSCALLWNEKEQRPLFSLNLFYIAVNIFGVLRCTKVL